jgi:putative restriction endonuclease
MSADPELALRERIMHALAGATARSGGTLTYRELDAFDVGGGEVRRLRDTSRGIWNPKDLAGTLTVVSSPDGPYDDSGIEDGYLHYDYRAGSADGDNAKLRVAAELGLPIILLRKIDRGVYVPIFPVYVVKDDRERRQFVIALDESLRFIADPLRMTPAQKRYAERVVRQRLHQPEFRGRVIRAYDRRCTVCLLKHADLLDAAHIIGDREDGGDPVVTNGLSLCKIHHAAYDRQLLGISPDYVVEINSDLMQEVDGPMLRHGLQEMNGRRLELPGRRADWPDRERLAARFAEFSAAS